MHGGEACCFRLGEEQFYIWDWFSWCFEGRQFFFCEIFTESVWLPILEAWHVHTMLSISERQVKVTHETYKTYKTYETHETHATRETHESNETSTT